MSRQVTPEEVRRAKTAMWCLYAPVNTLHLADEHPRGAFWKRLQFERIDQKHIYCEKNS